MQTGVAPERFCLANTVEGAHISCVFVDKQAGVLVVATHLRMSPIPPFRRSPLPMSFLLTCRGLPGIGIWLPSFVLMGPLKRPIRRDSAGMCDLPLEFLDRQLGQPPRTPLIFFSHCKQCIPTRAGSLRLTRRWPSFTPNASLHPVSTVSSRFLEKGGGGYQVKGISTHISASVMSRTLSQVSNPCSRNGPRYWVMSRAENAS